MIGDCCEGEGGGGWAVRMYVCLFVWSLSIKVFRWPTFHQLFCFCLKMNLKFIGKVPIFFFIGNLRSLFYFYL